MKVRAVLMLLGVVVAASATVNGAAGATIDGGGTTQILMVASPASVTVNTVTLQHGDAVTGEGGAALAAFTCPRRGI